MRKSVQPHVETNMTKWMMMTAVFLFGLYLRAAETETLETQTDWGSVTVPAEVAPGTKITVEIRVRDRSALDAVRLDLHGRDPQGNYAGFVRWGGGAVDIPENGIVEITVRAAPKKPKELGSVHALVIPMVRGDEGLKELKKITSADVKLTAP